MAEVAVTPGSWLNLSTLFDLNGVLFWGPLDYPDIPFSDQDVFVQLTQDQAKRPDLIAYDAYGDSDLIWIILLANDVDLPNQLIEGETIRIPARLTVENLLSVENQS